MAGQAATGAAGTVIGTNVLAPLVSYIGEAVHLPAMSPEVQLSIATILAAVITVASMAVRTLWRRKFGGGDDPTNVSGA